MKHNKITYALLALTVVSPALTFAALDGVKDLIKQVGGILQSLVPVIFGLSLIYFFWGVSQFILHSGEPKTRDEGRNKMIWGIVALFVFVSIWGILRFIGTSLGIPVPGSDAPSGSISVPIQSDPIPVGNPRA